MAVPRLLLRARGRPRAPSSAPAWYQQPLRPGGPGRQAADGPGRGSTLGPAGPRSRQEALGLLEAAVVYRAGPLVAVSKPPGLAVTGSPGQLSLVSLLPDLSQRLSLPPELHVVKAAGKDSSGLVLLSSCHGTTQQLHAFFTQLRRAGRPPATYRAVTAGVPAAMEGEIRTGLKLEQVGDLQLVVPVAAPSRRSVERKEVKQTLTRYKVLGAAPGCGLVQLQPMTAFPGQLLVHLTLLLCPALGDHVYSARVGTVLGEPFLLPAGSALPHTQVLGEQLLCKLRLTQQLLHRLPLHLHLHQLLLPTAILTAPPPPFFLQTLRLLGLPGDQSAP
ncbi:mitochondrial mRNA pseudouridine synthase RPUSD3 [Trachemys scripta elegans]|uniref:mitochondrial mRNA pseudouridine synthase RPUSD3 n=1 Tax=Trachemys scripta elegans TaxID=31138 RepID=UPI001551D937|nr:mitochondrial mRNA pseudouridine synthase RPUSD3 [Trachemys scripta elegans]